mgnify:FL=1
MTILVQSNNWKLIQKYDQFYIRYDNEQANSFVYDVFVTKAQANWILNTIDDPFALEQSLLTYYQEHITELQDYFITTAITDYVYLLCQCSSNDANHFLTSLNQHPDLRMLLYKTVMKNKMNKETGLAFYEIYRQLIDARESKKERAYVVSKTDRE